GYRVTLLALPIKDKHRRCLTRRSMGVVGVDPRHRQVNWSSSDALACRAGGHTELFCPIFMGKSA
ncbi:MAG: hypothetical protein ACXAB4_02240, partial [Candidatus Hodarchaeales archaeon]